MPARLSIVAGGTIFAATIEGFGIYFWNVGLEDANRLASVLAFFVGIAGLALALYGLFARDGGETPPRFPPPPQPQPQIRAGGDVTFQQGHTNINVAERGSAHFSDPGRTST